MIFKVIALDEILEAVSTAREVVQILSPGVGQP